MPESGKHPLLQLPGWPKIIDRYMEMQPADFALQMRSEFGELTPFLAEQLHAYPRAEKKLKGMHRPGWIYRKTSLEQSSSSAAARYKASLFQGDVCCDLTGGLGIDSLAFSERFRTVYHVEADPDVAMPAMHNLGMTAAGENIRFHCTTAERFLESFTGTADLMYIDPSRRDDGRRVFRLQDCTPDVITLKPLLNRHAANVMLKLSPVYDLMQLKREIPETDRIHVVSLRGDVREILAVSGTDNGQNEASVRAVLLDDDGGVRFSLERGMNDSRPDVDPGVLENEMVLFMPDAAIIKAGLGDHLANQLGLTHIIPGVDWFLNEKPLPEFPGRMFRILEVHDYKPGPLRKKFTKKGLNSAHIYRKAFPLSVPELHKKMQLPMGDDAHLVFLTDRNNQKKCLFCSLEEG